MIFSNSKYKLEDSIKTLLRFSLISGVIGVGLIFIFSLWAPGLFENAYLEKILQLYAFSLIGIKLNLLLNQALIKIDKSKVILPLSVMSNLIKLSLAVVAIQYYKSLEMMVVIYVIEPLISSLIQLWVLYKNNYLGGRYNSSIIKDLFSIGMPLYIVEILGASYTYISGFIISINLNEEQYAIYRNGSVELPVIGTIYGTISIIFMSDMMRYIEDRDYQKVASTKKRIINTTAMVIFPISVFFIIYSKEFITIYLSEKYIESYKIFIAFSMALLIRVQNYSDILIILKKSKLVLVSFVVFLIVNISLNLLLSNILGIVGCAIATVVSVYVLAYIQTYYTVKQLKTSFLNYVDLGKLCKMLALSILMIYTIHFSTSYIFSNIYLFFTFGLFICIPSLLILFIRKKYIDISIFENTFLKLPFIGIKLYNFLK